jgi:voltage-gated potassium channel
MTKRLQSYAFEYRFELLGIILTWIFFGGTFISSTIFYKILFPITTIFLMGISIIVLRDKRRIIRTIFIVSAVSLFVISLLNMLLDRQGGLELSTLLLTLLFFGILSFEVFCQMLEEKDVNRSIIVAAFDCYLLLGVMGAILFSILLYFSPDAFTNIEADGNAFNKMIYFSFITLTSVGYGDITPTEPVAQKFAALFGLVGHFYSVVIVGIIVGKYSSKSVD